MARYIALERLFSKSHKVYFLPGDIFDLEAGNEQEISNLIETGAITPCADQELPKKKTKESKESEVLDGSD